MIQSSSQIYTAGCCTKSASMKSAAGSDARFLKSSISNPLTVRHRLPSVPQKNTGNLRPLFFFFEDLSLNIICDLDESTDGYRITKHTKAEQIFADDTTNQTNYAQILYTYLTTSCQATETARLLHMHRNNVLYHIRRMETKYHLHLDQFEERLKLTLAMYAKKRV